ncbi:hypothetical protein KAT08_03745 [Candidatus Babeliales bacterium]|nr:hypothetical protein [Candidatus Babeliales bacterium]
MNKIFFLNFLFLEFLIITFFFGCSKKKNVNLARTYYKLSLLDLSSEDKLGKAPSQNSYKKALCNIEKAIEQEARAEYLAIKGTILFKLNKEEEGYEFFQKALHVKSDPQIKTEILNNKACLLAQLGMKSNQDEKIEKALQIWLDLQDNKDYLTPEVAFFNQSKVCFYKKEFEKAKENLVEAVSLEPDYLDAHYYLSFIAYNLNDFNLAKDHIETVLLLEPTHKGAQQLKFLLQKQ